MVSTIDFGSISLSSSLNETTFGYMTELVDVYDLGSYVLLRVGSSPAIPTHYGGNDSYGK